MSGRVHSQKENQISLTEECASAKPRVTENTQIQCKTQSYRKHTHTIQNPELQKTHTYNAKQRITEKTHTHTHNVKPRVTEKTHIQCTQESKIVVIIIEQSFTSSVIPEWGISFESKKEL